MISNRESARRSRMRKQQHLDDLVREAAQLKSENGRILMQISLLTQQYVILDGDNAVLRAQVMELTERLTSVNSVLRFVEEFSGFEMDIPEIPDPLMKPWRLSGFPAPPIMAASAEMFQF